MLAAEVGLAAAITLLLIPTLGMVAARSALLGALVFILPHALFAAFAFRPSAAASPGKALRAVYLGECVKLLVTLLLFAVSFALVKPLHIGVLLGMYGLLVVGHAGGFAWLTRNDTG